MDLDRYYTEIAAAFIRGTLNVTERNPEKLWLLAQQAELRLHKFKRNAELPRIRAVLGILQNIQPLWLLDIGSGRGVFLWPLLDTFPEVFVTATDIREDRIADIQAIHHGGMKNITAEKADVMHLPFEDSVFDVVTALETLEHLSDPTTAIQEVVRVSRKHAIFSVPSKEDSNPEHIHLLTPDDFRKALQDTTVNISFQYVLNHMIVFVTKQL